MFDDLMQIFYHLQSTLVSALSWTRQLEGETHSLAPHIGTASGCYDVHFHNYQHFITVRAMLSMVLPMALCLSVCASVSVCHKLEFY